MKIRVILSLSIVLLLMTALKLQHLYASPIAADATVGQLQDTAHANAWAKFIAEGGLTGLSFIGALIMLTIVWAFPGRNKPTGGAPVSSIASAVGLVMLLMSTGCMKPVKLLDPVEIGPNETAWVIPLDANTQNGQAKFNSVDYLQSKKVPAKRIMVDKVERKTGRFFWEIEWIPAVRVIKVDRSLVTCQWSDKTGGEGGIKVITKDSIKLTVGLTITASIDEDDASTYLYYHGERKLADVVNQNVRSFAVAELTRKFAELTLQDAQDKQNTIYSDLFKDAAAAFKSKGITIQYLGNAEGMHYDDPTIQASINQTYTAAQAKITAQQQFQAQLILNSNKVMMAQAEADAAAKLLAAKDATILKNHLEVQLIDAYARLAMATNWNGKMPANILPANSPMLMSLGTGVSEEPSSTTKK